MEQQATDIIVATRAALAQASALAVQYSFSILGALVLLVLGWFLSRLLHRWALTGLSRVRGIDATLAHFFANILRYAVLVLVFVTVLGQFGVQTASIIAALGAAGLAIGLALQGTLQNIAAGIMLLVLRPFRVGEYIETKDVSGEITEVGLFATELKTSDGLYRLAPNATLWNTPVTNYSRERTRKHDLQVKVPDDRDIDGEIDRLLSIAQNDPTIESVPPPQVFVDSLEASAAILTLRYWVATPQWFRTTREMNRRVRVAFGQKLAAPEPDAAPAE
ncbi:mechanosensitive ion channel protein [Shinella sp. SUS2]|uniref:mechanosensitive ion channel family protein n=1 Tax=unclassified Shinella TaxID=2643062 RepID=UPI000680D541|nr:MULTISPECIES: mechanosensitive ion channel family protein [unclassified Shinella]KNY18099.1 mechanosensitive ion channel protein [Shinella sp. SUS2]KOC77294.1 mechanosensitive ion channel protein [Shinella sp. GWS1]